MTAHLILKTCRWKISFSSNFCAYFVAFLLSASLVGVTRPKRRSDRGWPQRSASIGVVIRARADHPGQLSGELDAERVASFLLALFFSFLLLL